jgi:hypothetical protein
MIHELRIYHCMPGRREDVLKRFETITVPLWEKHGIRQLGFWTVIIGESNYDVYFIWEWDSLEERERKFNALLADPEWKAKKAETERNGPIAASVTSTLLKPTSFSARR